MGGEFTPSATPTAAARPASRRLGRFVRWLAVVTVVVLLGLEAILRVMGWHFAKKYDAYQKRALTERDCVTVLALGESTTGGLWVDPDQSYPAQLERILARKYGRPFCVVFPPHFGQNSTQMLNRIDHYLDAYSPRLVVLMCGVNNTWSLEESNIVRFMDGLDRHSLPLLLRITLDRSRVFKLGRMVLYDMEWRGRARRELAGEPRFSPWPPSDEYNAFGTRNREAFLHMWQYEIEQLIDRSRAHGASVVLMTYPNYDFPPVSEFEAMAARKNIPLQRNDLLFKPFLDPRWVDYYFFQDQGHPRPEGYGILASELAHLIEDRDLLHLGNVPPRS